MQEQTKKSCVSKRVMPVSGCAESRRGCCPPSVVFTVVPSSSAVRRKKKTCLNVEAQIHCCNLNVSINFAIKRVHNEVSVLCVVCAALTSHVLHRRHRCCCCAAVLLASLTSRKHHFFPPCTLLSPVWPLTYDAERSLARGAELLCCKQGQIVCCRATQLSLSLYILLERRDSAAPLNCSFHGTESFLLWRLSLQSGQTFTSAIPVMSTAAAQSCSAVRCQYGPFLRHQEALRTNWIGSGV